MLESIQKKKKKDIFSVHENPISHLLKISVWRKSKNSFYKVGEGREQYKAEGQYACGQPKINCFANATIPLSDLPKVLPCLHYKLDQLPEIGCMVVNGFPSL